MATSRSFTLQDVAKHDSAHNPYMVIRNKVYDCTSFLKKHPGGEEVLLEVAGTDATEAYDEVGHSEDADDILRELYLGDVVARVSGFSRDFDLSTKEYYQVIAYLRYLARFAFVMSSIPTHLIKLRNQ
ncbi:hypothetical protein LCI18_000027 [Fusarium solani-melongenae]|uniref:Uncharacterized protein n=1 Tax=Fusarium solani subsp. cucurbitae TaxID=2747967 RepID=A0ACD3YJQ5_FUSSC|nr:hypothetical protein LCI18_000027 [Fusarium solani-melongenae]